MHDKASVEKRIARWFLTELNLEIPSARTDLFETGVLDSMGFVELMLHLEREFGIRMTLEDLEIEHFRSVERIAAFLLDGGPAAHDAERAGLRETA